MLRVNKPHFLEAPRHCWKTKASEKSGKTLRTLIVAPNLVTLFLLKLPGFRYFLYLIYYMGSFSFSLTLFNFLFCCIISLSFSEFTSAKIMLKKELYTLEETNNGPGFSAPCKKKIDFLQTKFNLNSKLLQKDYNILTYTRLFRFLSFHKLRT